jgi:hypothetical protein
MVSLDERNQRQIPGPLDRRTELALVPGAGPGRSSGKDLAPVRDHPAQRVGILVVDPLDVALAELAYLSESHRSVSLLDIVVIVSGVALGRRLVTVLFDSGLLVLGALLVLVLGLVLIVRIGVFRIVVTIVAAIVQRRYRQLTLRDHHEMTQQVIIQLEDSLEVGEDGR